MSLDGFEWNQAVLEDPNCFDQGLISLIAFDNQRHPRLIGTGFIIGAYGDSAIAATAAHNLEAIKKVQQPVNRYHPTALPEFIANYDVIDFDKKRVRALCLSNSKIDLSIINLAVWDKNADIGFLFITHQDKQCDFFGSFFSLSEATLEIGENVALLGYADMEILSASQNGKGKESFSMQKSPLLRCGYITNIYPTGHILCRGACIETSIPVFPGMSGGPVFRLGRGGEQIVPFGVLSSDPEDESDKKCDRSKRGASIVALLNAKIQSEKNGIKKVMLQLMDAYMERSND